LLRKHLQHLHHTHFIFSGSEKHLLLPMFLDNSRPLYQSTQFMRLGKIKYADYKQFIQKHFKSGGIQLEDNAADFILDWTNRHTYYTQYVCNYLYSTREEKLDVEKVKSKLPEILKGWEAILMNYSKLLSFHQFQLLKAIAKENVVTEPTSQIFLKKHDLSGVSTVRKSLSVLIEKGLVNEELKDKKPEYMLNDVFLMRWLEIK